MRLTPIIIVGIAVAAGCSSSHTPTDDGWTTYTTAPLPAIQPSSDTMFVQWLTPPFEEDTDVLDVTGTQSQGGHHVILFATTVGADVGTTKLWTPADMDGLLRYEGGLGEGADNTKLPPGTVFRVPAGQSIIANLHYLNPTASVIDNPSAVIKFKFAKPAPDRRPIGIFVNLNSTFEVQAGAHASADADCVVQGDLQLIRYANHMHGLGTSIHTEVIHPDGTTTPFMQEPTWDPNEYLNPKLLQWTPDQPFLLHPGDHVHTHCEWSNTTSHLVKFPEEMCGSVGYFVSTDGHVQVCLDQKWFQ